jgi:hypothetical protein
VRVKRATTSSADPASTLGAENATPWPLAAETPSATSRLATAWGKSDKVRMSPVRCWQPPASGPPWQAGSPGAHRLKQTAPRFWAPPPGKRVMAVRICDSGSGTWLGLLTANCRSKLRAICAGGGPDPKSCRQTRSAATPSPAWARPTRGQ